MQNKTALTQASQCVSIHVPGFPERLSSQSTQGNHCPRIQSFSLRTMQKDNIYQKLTKYIILGGDILEVFHLK